MSKGRVSGRSSLRACPRHNSHQGLALLVGAMTLVSSAGHAQQTTFVFEQTMSKLPVDVELTPNGALAIVRGNAPGSSAAEGLLVLDAGTGNKLFLNGCSPSVSGFGGFFKSKPSDFLRVTNSRAILVGGRDTDMDLLQDRTYIDVLAFDMSADPPSVSCLATTSLGVRARRGFARVG